MIKKILIGFLVLAIAFVIIVALQPAEFSVSRSTMVSAPADAAFAQVNDFHRWEAWSPWAKLDPAMKETFDGPPAGPGAIYRWEGNNDVGAGQMTILESRPSEMVRIKLDFLRPFAATNMTQFDFQPQDDQTIVTWSMSGQKNFLSKAFGLFVNMDKMIGRDFEKGLTQMKALAEASVR